MFDFIFNAWYLTLFNTLYIIWTSQTLYNVLKVPSSICCLDFDLQDLQDSHSCDWTTKQQISIKNKQNYAFEIKKFRSIKLNWACIVATTNVLIMNCNDTTALLNNASAFIQEESCTIRLISSVGLAWKKQVNDQSID